MIGYYYYRNRERGGVSLNNNSFVCLNSSSWDNYDFVILSDEQSRIDLTVYDIRCHINCASLAPHITVEYKTLLHCCQNHFSRKHIVRLVALHSKSLE